MSHEPPSPCDLSGAVARLEDAARLLSDRKCFRHAPKPWSRPVWNVFAGAVITRSPISITVQWGLGRERSVTEAESQSLAHVHFVLTRLADAVGVALESTLLITDTHAALNGVSPDVIEARTNDLIMASGAHGWAHARLSAVLPSDHCSRIRDAARNPSFREYSWAQIPDGLRDRLVLSATRHSRIQSALQAAQAYVAMCACEAGAISHAYAGSVFATFQAPECAFLLPPLPTVFMYAYPDRNTRRPWFCESHAE